MNRYARWGYHDQNVTKNAYVTCVQSLTQRLKLRTTKRRLVMNSCIPNAKTTKTKLHCHECDFYSTSFDKLWKHKKRHKYKQPLFKESFKQDHPIKNTFVCTECHYKCDNIGELLKHKLTHRTDSNLTPIGNGDTSSNVHLEAKGEAENSSECDSKSSKKECQDEHVMKHAGAWIREQETHDAATPGKPIQCSQCNIEFDSPEALVAHIKYHTSGSLNDEHQNLVISMDISNENIVLHTKPLSTDNIQDLLRLECDIPTSNDINELRTFSQYSEMPQHANDMTSICGLCNKIENHECIYKCNFRNDLELQINSHENSNLEDDQFECSLCDYVSSSEEGIQEHSLLCKGE
ncbi:unnamed protein product [Meganyctiphanes norvegica]|uniref:C2H2-type domain-containing protein n=1 Tax=Meganyctiphanes norvegica TaxID=48144 RepID=A0AAV2SL53_MEGNR